MPSQLKILTDLDTPDAAYEFYQSYLAIENWRDADKIIQKYGRGTFTYYDEMVDSDAVISGVLESRIHQVAALDWVVIPASEDEADLELANFITDLFDKMDYFYEYLVNILGALRNGFSVQLVNWDLVDGNYIPKELLSCNPDYFRFGKDRKLRIIESSGDWEGTEVPDYRFLKLSFQPRYSNPYGVSLLRPIYWPWWFKHHGIKWWLQAAERGAVVTPVGYYAQNASDDEQAKLANALKLFKGNQYVATSETNKIEFPHITVDPELTRLLVDTLDSAIRYRIEGSMLASGTTTSGTRALGEVHEKKTQVRIEADAKALMITVNRLVQWICDLNFPNAVYPIWKLKYEIETDTASIRENLKVIVPFGAKISAQKATELLQLPIAMDDEEILMPPQQGGGGGSPISIPMSKTKEDVEDKDNSFSDSADNTEGIEDLEGDNAEAVKKKASSRRHPLRTELDEILTEWKN